MQALTAPLARTFALGGLLLALGIGATVLHGERSTSSHKLTLHAPIASNAIYLTAWADGPIYLDFDMAKPPGWELTSEAWYAGCHWRAVETLEPIDTHTYSYDYSETLLGCRPGYEPTAKTPRQGYVTVDY